MTTVGTLVLYAACARKNWIKFTHHNCAVVRHRVVHWMGHGL